MKNSQLTYSSMVKDRVFTPKTRLPAFTLAIQHCTRSSRHSNYTSKTSKRHPNWKEVKHLSADDMILHTGMPWRCLVFSSRPLLKKGNIITERDKYLVSQ